mgnify:CR=1 FL=1
MNDAADEDRKIIADEIRVLYSASIAEVAGFKQQQWQVTNYGLVLFATIASATRFLGSSIEPYEYIFLGAAALAVHVCGLGLIGVLASSIQGRRERLTHIRTTYFSEAFRDAWRAGKSADQAHDRPEEKTQLRMLFQGVYWAGFLSTLWYLWRTASGGIH